MDDTTLLTRYFPELAGGQLAQLERLPQLYREWTERINVISRKDTDHIVEHHLLHSMAIARWVRFRPGTRIVDVGTGGGLPGIPLAILFPECRFTLIDGTGKKVRVARAIAEAAGLANVTAVHARAEEWEGRYHFVVSRAAMDLSALVRTSAHLIERKEQPGPLPNGFIVLKGGDLEEELRPFRPRVQEVEIPTLLEGIDYFEHKKIIYLPFR